MRIIDPKINESANRKNDTSSSNKKFQKYIIFLVVFGLLVLATITIYSNFFLVEKATERVSDAEVTTAGKNTGEESNDLNKTVLKQFSGEDFKALYQTFAYPNVMEVTNNIEITGNTAVDERIRQVALDRGYRLQVIPKTSLFETSEGWLLQQKAVEPWHMLRDGAQNDGIGLKLISTFRNIDEQRNLFLIRLLEIGVTHASIADGRADTALNQLMSTTAPPGYSKHHTGYTIDLECVGEEGVFFENTRCYRWLSANNYENSKKYGWVPSYPSGATVQGPEPEAWEYIWVGTEMLFE